MIIHNLNKPQNPKRVIVIGGSGFIGRQVVQELQGADVPVLSLSSKDVDLTQESSRQFLLQIMAPSDVIVFLSALTPVHSDSATQEITRFQRNLAMVENLCWVLAQTAVQHLVCISSVAVYSNSIEHDINENTATSPESLYGMAHLARELMLAKVLPQEKLCILRPCAIYGFGDPHYAYGPNRFLQLAAQGKDIQLFGQGEELRHHLHVSEVVKVIIQTLLLQSYGKLNLTSTAAISFMDVAKKIIALPNVNVSIKNVVRNIQVTHQKFNNAALLVAFPDLLWIDLDEGLEITYGDYH